MTDTLTRALRAADQGVNLGADGMGWSPDPTLFRQAADEIERLTAALAAASAPGVPAGSVVAGREVSQAAFELCEFIEDINDKLTDTPAAERFKAGQRYAAKWIRNGLGTWLTDEENRRKDTAPAQHQPSLDALRLAYIVDDLWFGGAPEEVREASRQALTSSELIAFVDSMLAASPPPPTEQARLTDTAEGRTYTQADILEAVQTERHACSICVWMVLQDALEPGADDKGLEGWMREAEQRVKNRLAHHGPPYALQVQQPVPADGFCWLVEEFGPDGNSTGRYMLDQGALTITSDVYAARRFRRWQSAGFRALDMKAQHKSDWRAVEHGFGVAATRKDQP